MASDLRTVGVEEEFLLLHRDEPRLFGIGPDVVEAAAAADDDAQFEKELKAAQTESASAPATSLGELAGELATRRHELARAAAERRARLVCSATSPVPGHSSLTDDDRYRAMDRRFAAIVARQLTCGMHVHVEVFSPDEGVRVINGIAPWLPALLALSSNSPFHSGRDSGYASYRRMLWDQWPTAGPTEPFADHAHYRRVVDELITAGAARDQGMIYFDARLSHRYPTVEVRVCDVCPDVDAAITLAGLTRALVHTVATQPDAAAGHCRVELLRAAAWRAARYGMTGELVQAAGGPVRRTPAWDAADQLIGFVGPALDGFGDTSRVPAGLARLRERGTGAERQRAAGSPAAAADAMTVLTRH